MSVEHWSRSGGRADEGRERLYSPRAISGNAYPRARRKGGMIPWHESRGHVAFVRCDQG
jgi:hypothetical protein